MKQLFQLLLLFFVIQCQTMDQGKEKYPEPPFRPELTAKRTFGGTVTFSLALTGSGTDESPSLRFVRSIRDITLIVRTPSGREDTLDPILSSSGQVSQDYKTASLTIHGEALWDNPSAEPFDSLTVHLLIETFDAGNYLATYTFFLPPVQQSQQVQPPLKIEPRIEQEDDSTIVFVLLAERVRFLEREYFPTSERLRVEIYDQKGNLLWSSAVGRAFLQVIGPVEPQSIGEVYRYELDWNGTDQNGQKLPPGHYTAKLILPIVPAPMQATVEFTLPLQNEH